MPQPSKDVITDLAASVETTTVPLTPGSETENAGTSGTDSAQLNLATAVVKASLPEATTVIDKPDKDIVATTLAKKPAKTNGQKTVLAKTTPITTTEAVATTEASNTEGDATTTAEDQLTTIETTKDLKKVVASTQSKLGTGSTTTKAQTRPIPTRRPNRPGAQRGSGALGIGGLLPDGSNTDLNPLSPSGVRRPSSEVAQKQISEGEK